MKKLILGILIMFSQFAFSAENELPTETSDQGETESIDDVSDSDSDLIGAEIIETIGEDEESSVRFIPTEEISQDLGVSFPVDI